MASPRRPAQGQPPAGTEDGSLRGEIAELVAEKIALKIDQATIKQKRRLAVQREKVARARADLDADEQRSVHGLERLTAHLEALEVWTRSAGAGRRPRFTREEIATAALGIADAEGFEALSMRRLAAELGAGTMTLYHYIRTKDELLTLVSDAVMGELLIPDDEPLPDSWRARVTEIAERTRRCLQAHPWIFDVTSDPPIGPNAMRHFDQTMRALAPLDLPLTERIELVNLLDEYVFGYCLHERHNLYPGDTGAEGMYSEGMVEYMTALLTTGDYPELQKIADDVGLAGSLQTADLVGADPTRFRRNLDRILDGIEAGLTR